MVMNVENHDEKTNKVVMTRRSKKKVMVMQLKKNM
jgi:hypothetical protein